MAKEGKDNSKEMKEHGKLILTLDNVEEINQDSIDKKLSEHSVTDSLIIEGVKSNLKDDHNNIQRSSYDPSLYNRRSEYGYNPMMSTNRFINDIDLRCDDHLNKHKEDFQADRFCSECKTLCCDSCVIEYHHSHIHSAKTRVEEYFKKHKIEIEELKSKVTSSIKNKTVLNEFNLTMDIQEKNISTFFLKRKNFLENLKMKIESLLSDENDLCSKMKECLQMFYQDECLRKIDKPLKELDNLQFRLQTFLKDWDTFSRTDKARALKNNQVVQFKDEESDLSQVIKNSIEVFKKKSKILEYNMNEIMKLFSMSDKLNQIESDIYELSSKIKTSFTQVNKMNFDELVINEVVEVIKVENPKIESNISLQKNKSEDSFSLIDNSNRENNKSIVVNQPIIQSNYNSNSIIKDDQKRLAEHLSSSNPCDLLIGLRHKTNEIVIFDPVSGYHTIKLDKSFFQDQSNTFTAFPDNCRYVNIGFTILMTGGLVERQTKNNCYLIVASKKENIINQGNPFDVSIMSYTNMIEPRERHNIIYIPHINSVIVCSGFFNTKTEICDLDKAQWNNIAPLNEPRANATVACVNKRYVWIFGGFKLDDAKKTGIYTNTCEVLDLNNMSKWNVFDFDKLKLNLRMCAMGVVNIQDNAILLCGGYDGNKYNNEVRRVDFKDDSIVSVKDSGRILPNNMIFIHNNFVRIQNSISFNFDLNLNVINFNPNDYKFDFQVKLN